MREVLILAGGLGTRLRDISGELPKSMVLVGGIPFLYRLMQKAQSEGFDKIVLALGYKSDYIRDRILIDLPVDIQVVFSIESEPLGTGGAIKNAYRLLQNDTFLVINGDTFVDYNLGYFFDNSLGLDLSILAVKLEDVDRYGAIEFDSNGKVTKFIEKGLVGSGYINSGAYVLNKKILDCISGFKFSFEEDILFARSSEVRVFAFQGIFIDIGIPEDYHKADKMFS